MVYRGHIQKGVVVFDGPAELAEGTEVTVQPVDEVAEKNGRADESAQSGSEPEGEFFIHSSGLRPWCVVKEPAAASPALLASRYRVYGKLTADDAATRRWLLGKHFATRTR